MSNVRTRGGRLSAAPSDLIKVFHRGWVDAQNSPHRWPREYETMSRQHQLAYEAGRLQAVNVKTAGPMPVWDGTEQRIGPVSDAIDLAIAQTGLALAASR